MELPQKRELCRPNPLLGYASAQWAFHESERQGKLRRNPILQAIMFTIKWTLARTSCRSGLIRLLAEQDGIKSGELKRDFRRDRGPAEIDFLG
jgi:hypothetical protein